MTRRPVQSIDGILPPSRRRNVYVTVPAPGQAPERVVSFKDDDVLVKLPRRRVIYARGLSLLQYVFFAVLALIAAGNSTLGQYFVLAFALYVVALRKNSQLTFIIALLLLVSVPLFQLLKQTGVADNMAIYTYELLVVGTVQAIIELKWPSRQNRKHNKEK